MNRTPGIDRDLGIRLIEEAIKKGADQAEAYIRKGSSLTIEVKGQKVEAIESAIDSGYSLRIIRDGRLGFTFSTDPDAVDEAVERAMEASRWTEKDEFLSLPERSDTIELNILDPSISGITEEDAIEKALQIERAALKEDNRIKKIRKASATFSEKEIYICNSLGLSKGYKATACTAQIMVVAEENGDGQIGWDFYGGRFLKSIPFDEIGRNAARRALNLLGAKNVNPERVKVILDSSVSAEFLGLFSTLLSSENVQKGKSLLAGRLRQKVISPLIDIVDDATMADYLGSRPFDDEGVAASRHYLIREGVLEDYMYNTYTARKGGKNSTGNAIRSGFSSLPSVGPTNIYINTKGVKVSLKSLLGSLDKGVYIIEIMGLHTANPISGEFSIGISGIWIENGIMRHPIKEAIISGNILDMFERIEAVGDDLRFYGNTGAPSLLIGPTDLSA